MLLKHDQELHKFANIKPDHVLSLLQLIQIKKSCVIFFATIQVSLMGTHCKWKPLKNRKKSP